MAAAELHPNVADLEGFALGTLDTASLAGIEAHVANCPSCQERAAGIVSGDTLVELLRRAHGRMSGASDTVPGVSGQAPTPAPVATDSQAVTLPPATPWSADAVRSGVEVPPELSRHERYRVVRLLGQGGMGNVYEAEHRVMQRPVALKIINRAYTANAVGVERFRREVRAAARLSHTNIVTTYDAEDAGNALFLVMEYVEGISLARLVKERGPLSVVEACVYARQAALGLQHAHERGMVHRDVKPDNLILVTSKGSSTPGVVKVLDFGLAALTAERDGRLTDTNVIMGTPDYMAPEQAEDPRTTDTRADVYSLGCTLYFLLTGNVVYPAATPLLKILAHREQPVPDIRRERPDVPPELAAVMARMLAKTPQERYQTPAEAAAALEPFTRPAAEPPKKRRQLFVALAAAASVALITLAATVVYRVKTDKGELVITTESDDVEVVIKQGGKIVRIIDTKTDKSITLDSGLYELELKGAPSGLKLSIDRATLMRGKQTLATIERVEEKVGEIHCFEGHKDAVVRALFTPDKRRMVSSSTDGTVCGWDLATRKEIWCKKLASDLSDPCFSPDGRSFWIGSRDPGDLCVYQLDLESGEERKRVFKGNKAPPVGLVLTSDGRRIIASDGAEIRIWDVRSGDLLHTLEGHTSQVQLLSLSSNDRRLLSGACDCSMRMWDVDTGKQLQVFTGHSSFVRGVAFLPDGKRGLSGGYDGTVRLWDLASGKEIRKFTGHKWAILGVAVSPDGRRALSAAGHPDSTIRLWDIETGQEIHRIDKHGNGVFSVAFSADGKRCLSASYDKTVRLWRLPDSTK
jgi:WD40 repeat protein/tRNA A-37 threonylcarbamoyl transferase component Bud32